MRAAEKLSIHTEPRPRQLLGAFAACVFDLRAKSRLVAGTLRERARRPVFSLPEPMAQVDGREVHVPRRIGLAGILGLSETPIPEARCQTERLDEVLFNQRQLRRKVWASCRASIRTTIL